MEPHRHPLVQRLVLSQFRDGETVSALKLPQVARALILAYRLPYATIDYSSLLIATISYSRLLLTTTTTYKKNTFFRVSFAVNLSTALLSREN